MLGIFGQGASAEGTAALDIVIGETSFRDGRSGYGHLTYLLTPIVARGSSVDVPIRLGIGAALQAGFQQHLGHQQGGGGR